MFGNRRRLAIGASPKSRPRLGPVARGVGLALVVGLLLARLFVVQVVVVRGNTMAPNVLDGDGLLVYPMDQPRRGDVVLVSLGGQAVLRRVVGLPGERIGSAGGVLTRDEVPAPTRVAGVFEWRSVDEDGDERPHRQQRLAEGLDEGHGHYVLGDYEGAARPWALELPELEVPPGHLFVLCDNRRLCPLDERAGVIPQAAVEGVARSLLWYGEARAKAPPGGTGYGSFAPLASGAVPELAAPARK